jgi:hypothetical protein
MYFNRVGAAVASVCIFSVSHVGVYIYFRLRWSSSRADVCIYFRLIWSSSRVAVCILYISIENKYIHRRYYCIYVPQPRDKSNCRSVVVVLLSGRETDRTAIELYICCPAKRQTELLSSCISVARSRDVARCVDVYSWVKNMEKNELLSRRELVSDWGEVVACAAVYIFIFDWNRV